MIHPSLPSGEETIQEILGQDVPTESVDQDRLALYLRDLLQAQMQRAAATADEVARAHTFETYREPLRPNTLRRQRADLSCFMHYLDEAGIPMTETCERLGTHMYLEPDLWRHVTFGLVLGFRRWQLLEGYTIESVNAHLSTVKTYARLACTARFLPAEELIYINLVRRVRTRDAEQVDEQRKKTRIGAKKAEPTYLEAEHLQRLFAARPDTDQGWRDLLALRLLYDQALRPSEAITRTIGDLDLQNGTIAVYRKKTRLRQHLPLSKGTMVALTNYLPLLEKKYKEALGELYPRRNLYPRLALLVRTRRDEKFDAAEKLIIPDTGPIVAWTTQAMYERVRDLGEEIGIDNLCPYDARHTFARGVVKAGNDRTIATKFGGWRTDSKMLDRYFGDEEVVSSVHLPWE